MNQPQRVITLPESLAITLFVVVILWVLCWYLEPNTGNILDYASRGATVAAFIVGLSALLITFRDILNRRKAARHQVVNTIKSQLGLIRHWVAGPNDDLQGWQRTSDRAEEDKRKYTWARPLNSVNEISTTPLEAIWSLPGVAELPKNFTDKLALLMQLLLNFNAAISSFRLLVSSAGALTIAGISNKLKSAGTDQYSLARQKLTEPEKPLTDLFVEANERLHYVQIGARGGKGLCDMYHELIDELSRIFPEEDLTIPLNPEDIGGTQGNR